MNQKLLYILILLIIYTILNKTSDKFIEYLSEEDPLCPILKDEWNEKKCGNFLGIGDHTNCSRIKEEAKKLNCNLN